MLLSSKVLSQTANCDPTTNKFLAWFTSAAAGVSAEDPSLTKPQAKSGDWPICATTWGTEGTCCDPTKFQTAYKKIIDTHVTEWGKFIAGVKKYVANKDKLKQVAGGADVKTKFEAVDAANKDGLTSDQAKAFVDKLDTIKDDITTFKAKALDCFKATNVLRTNVFCVGCQNSAGISQPASVMFARFVSGTCNTAVKACAPVWSFMFGLQAQLKVAYEVRRKEKSGNAATGFSKFPNAKTFGDIATLVSNCATGEVVSGKCTQANLDEFCIAFFNFKKVEPVIVAPVDADITYASTTSRLLQGPDVDGSLTLDSDGLELNKQTTVVSEPTTQIDVSKTGELDATPTPTPNNTQQSTSGNILMVSLIAALVTATAL